MIPWEGESGGEVTTPDPAATRDAGQEAGGAVGLKPACTQASAAALGVLGVWAHSCSLQVSTWVGEHRKGCQQKVIKHRTRAGATTRNTGLS